MSNCNVALNCAIPSRFIKETIASGTLIEVIFTGSGTDTSNFDLSVLSEWDSAKTDYTIGYRVKIEDIKTEYICGIDGTTVNPMLSRGDEWHKLGSTNDFKFKNGSPDSPSIKAWDAGDPNITIELDLGSANNFLFIQNLKDVKEIIIESIGDTTEEIHREDTYKLAKFSFCSCCLTRYEYLNNFTLPLDSCGNYSRIKVTLVPIDNSIAGVGVCAVGEYMEIGKLYTYPIPTVSSDFKFTIEEQGLALPVNTNVYMNYSLTVYELNTDSQNDVYLKLIENVGALNFYEITNMKNNIFTTFVGTHKGFKPKITNEDTTNIAIDIYAIPTKNEGVS